MMYGIIYKDTLSHYLRIRRRIKSAIKSKPVRIWGFDKNYQDNWRALTLTSFEYREQFAAGCSRSGKPTEEMWSEPIFCFGSRVQEHERYFLSWMRKDGTVQNLDLLTNRLTGAVWWRSEENELSETDRMAETIWWWLSGVEEIWSKEKTLFIAIQIVACTNSTLWWKTDPHRLVGTAINWAITRSKFVCHDQTNEIESLEQDLKLSGLRNKQ
jgi:hypothetical protein